MKGIILHGGYGTRLRPLTHTGPKQLIPVANKPISQHVLEDLRDSGIKEIVIVLGDLYPEKVIEHYEDGKKFGVNIKYVHQGKPKGIAHAISLCREFICEDPFVVYLGDNLLKDGIKTFSKEFKNSNYDGMILLSKVKNPQRFGVAKFNNEGKIVKLIEKPIKPPSDYALTGIYFFNSTIFKMIDQLKPSQRGELEITEAIQLLLNESHNVCHKLVKGWWKDTGTPEDILESNRLLLDELKHEVKGVVEDDASLQGRILIEDGAVIKRGALVRGPTVIGKSTIIEKSAYIDPYTSIGNNVVIKKGEIGNSIIMDNCYIDIEEKITDSIIGSSSRITMKQRGPKGHRFIVGEGSKIEI